MCYFLFAVAEADPCSWGCRWYIGGDVGDTELPFVEVEVEPEVHTELVPSGISTLR